MELLSHRHACTASSPAYYDISVCISMVSYMAHTAFHHLPQSPRHATLHGSVMLVAHEIHCLTSAFAPISHYVQCYAWRYAPFHCGTAQLPRRRYFVQDEAISYDYLVEGGGVTAGASADLGDLHHQASGAPGPNPISACVPAPVAILAQAWLKRLA